MFMFKPWLPGHGEGNLTTMNIGVTNTLRSSALPGVLVLSEWLSCMRALTFHQSYFGFNISLTKARKPHPAAVWDEQVSDKNSCRLLRVALQK